MGWTNAAPGPDGITIQVMRKTPDDLLAALFTIILLRNIHSECFCLRRTIRIYKDGDKKDAANYRPITIGSPLQRLMHRVLNNRINNTIEMDKQQRGFVTGDGILANAIILDQYIKSKRVRGMGFNIMFLDLRKAFDIVSRSSMITFCTKTGL